MTGISRRGIITGLMGLVAAPAVLRLGEHMSISVFEGLVEAPYDMERYEGWFSTDMGRYRAVERSALEWMGCWPDGWLIPVSDLDDKLLIKRRVTHAQQGDADRQPWEGSRGAPTE